MQSESLTASIFEGRLHPLTIAFAIAWTKTLSPFTQWIAPHHLLAGLFAAIGALGVRAALSAFEVVVPRRYVLLCGLIYACSLGTWYFASIAESKILTASLSTAYIAVYLHLRRQPNLEGTLLLNFVLAAACANEIVSAFLVVIPAVDALLQRRLNFKTIQWMAVHSTIPVLFLIFDSVLNQQLGAEPQNAESGSSVSMFWFYANLSDHSLSSLYSFLLNWFCFNIAAPTPNAYAAVPIWPTYFGYFEPSFHNYFDHVFSVAVIAIAALMVVGSVAPGWRAERLNAWPIILPLMAFNIVRGVFFFIFNPAEVMLFCSAVTLPNLFLLLIPFSASRFPAKALVLGGFAAALFATNLRFMIV